MKKVKDKSVARTLAGEPLATAIPYTFEFDAFESYAEMVAAGAGLSEKEQLKARNAKRKNAARTEAANAALDAAGIVRPTAENNDSIRLRDMVRTMLTAKLADGTPKYTEESAREAAAELLGITLDDDGE